MNQPQYIGNLATMKNGKAFNVYRSSAGSGKTYTLVKEYLRLALATGNANSFKYILAITFTNKAAEEMKNRVLETLKEISRIESNNPNQLRAELAELNSTDEHTIATRANAMLKSMLHNYSDLAISTIDKFVHRLVRSFSRDLMLSHDFEVDTDTDVYLDEAISKLVQQVGQSPEITQTLIDFISDKIENDASWQIKDLLMQAGKKILDREGAEHVKTLSEFDTSKFDNLNKQLSAFIARYENHLKQIAYKAVVTIKNAGLDDADFYFKGRGIFALFRKIADGEVNTLPSNTITQSVHDQRFSASEKDPRANELAAPLTGYFNEISAYREKNLGNYELCLELKKYLRQLSLLTEINKSLTDVKEENNLIFIDDFHQKISEVVKNEPSPFIYERIGNKYRYLLIDEFQDTSVLQWHNFLPLVEHALSENHFVLLVGDGKQAIYRFRGGEVEQFDHLPEIFGYENEASLKEKSRVLKNHFQHKNLPSNFRSLGKIVAFNNQLYENLKSRLPESLASIYHGQSQIAEREADEGFVVVHFLDPKNGQDGKAKKTDELAREKLNLLTASINECKTDGFDYNDICIIVRSGKDGALVANYLSEKGIQVISDESLLVASHPDVKVLVAALNYLAQISNNETALNLLIHLAQVYHPGRLDEMLSKHTKKEKNRLIWVNIKGFFAENDIKWSEKYLLSLSLYDLIENLVRTIKPINRSSAHLSFFKQHVLNFATKKSNDILSFIAWWNEKQDKISINVPGETEAVQIMTIHKSKGLQFPVVILPFCDWNFNARQRKVHWVSTPESLKTAVDCEIPSAMLSQLGKNVEATPLSALANQENNRIILDNLNLLYVATTRPQERLYIYSIFDIPKNEASNIKHWLSAYATLQNWSLPMHSFGIASAPKRKKSPNPGILSTPVAVNEGWSKKIKINLEAGELLDGSIIGSFRARGKLMHRLLAELNHPEELRSLIDNYISQGIMNNSEAEKISSQIQLLLQLPESEEWYSGKAKMLNEKAIITPNGETYRPDRILISDKNALIIDFKTGAYDAKHQQQIKQYGSLLQTMGYQCRLQLAYLEKPEIVHVPLTAQTSIF